MTIWLCKYYTVNYFKSSFSSHTWQTLFGYLTKVGTTWTTVNFPLFLTSILIRHLSLQHTRILRVQVKRTNGRLQHYWLARSKYYFVTFGGSKNFFFFFQPETRILSGCFLNPSGSGNMLRATPQLGSSSFLEIISIFDKNCPFSHSAGIMMATRAYGLIL